MTANITLDELFSDRERFKKDVVERIDEVIDDFGLVCYNANISELVRLFNAFYLFILTIIVNARLIWTTKIDISRSKSNVRCSM